MFRGFCDSASTKESSSNGHDGASSFFNTTPVIRNNHESTTASTTTMKTTMATLEDEIADLSFEERETAYNELHCVPHIPIENKDNIQLGLYELDCCLKKLVADRKKNVVIGAAPSSPQRSSRTSGAGSNMILNHNNDTDDRSSTTSITNENNDDTYAYRIAMEQNHAYVEDRNFRLMFLRAEKYNSQEAAERMLRFFTLKLRLFGKDLLSKDILYQDLPEDDILVLKTGFLQFCPLRDRAGRKVFIVFPHLRRMKSLESFLRVHFFYSMSAIEDETDQIKGISILVYHLRTNETGSSYTKKNLALGRGSTAMPLRIAVIHVCMVDSLSDPVLQILFKFMDRVSKFTHRLHYGSHTECLYTLQGFGVPVCALPFHEEGQQDGSGNIVSLDNHWRWIHERQTRDQKRMELPLRNVTSSGPRHDDSKNSFMFSFLEQALEGEDFSSLLDIDIENHRIQGMNHDQLAVPSSLLQTHVVNTTEAEAKKHGETSHVERNGCGSGIGGGNFLVGKVQSTKTNFGGIGGCGGDFQIKPTNMDVLCGKGRPLQKHPGNVQFREVLSARFDQYESSSKHMKTIIAENVIRLVKDGSGGRFLKPVNVGNGPIRPSDDNVIWEEVDDRTCCCCCC